MDPPEIRIITRIWPTVELHEKIAELFDNLFLRSVRHQVSTPISFFPYCSNEDTSLRNILLQNIQVFRKFFKQTNSSKIFCAFNFFLKKAFHKNKVCYKDTLKAFGDFKIKVYKVMFVDIQKYLYSESVFNTLNIEIKHKS